MNPNDASLARTTSTSSSRLRPFRLAALASALLVSLAGTSRAELIATRMTPINGATNEAALTLKFGAQTVPDTTTVQPGSTLDFTYDTTTHVLTMTDAALTGSNLDFYFGTLLDVTAENVEVAFDPQVTPTQVTVDPVTGLFTGFVVPVIVTGKITATSPLFPAPIVIIAAQSAAVTMSGNFSLDDSGTISITNFTGAIAPIIIPVFPPLISVTLAGSLTLNVQDTSVTLDPIPGVARVGDTLTLTGQGFTPGSLLKVFVATSNGVVDVAPSGIAPTSVSADGLVWNGTLPWPWPVSAPNDVLVGNGFADMYLVRTDAGFTTSNDQGVVLLGNPNLDPQVPSITAIDGTSLSATSSDTSIATANIEDVIVPGNETTIAGSGFVNPVVNIFSASGNCAPPGGIVPTISSSTSLTMTVPVSCPVGPGSVQVINATGAFLTSNAVSIPIGELVTISSVQVNGSTITVNGSGFNSLTVINLFAGSNGGVVNAGGLSGGNPNIPLTIVNSQQFTFTRPDGLDAGNAFIQAINPPFIPFTNSGTGPTGSFALP